MTQTVRYNLFPPLYKLLLLDAAFQVFKVDDLCMIGILPQHYMASQPRRLRLELLILAENRIHGHLFITVTGARFHISKP